MDDKHVAQTNESFIVRRHIELDAGHRVPYHASQCRHLHGHRYRVTAVVRADGLVRNHPERSDSGMVLDFGAIKSALLEVVHGPCDHRLLLWEKDPLVSAGQLLQILDAEGLLGAVVLLPCIPTAEELARYWGQHLLRWFEGHAPGVYLAAVEVQETPTSMATWWWKGDV